MLRQSLALIQSFLVSQLRNALLNNESICGKLSLIVSLLSLALALFGLASNSFCFAHLSYASTLKQGFSAAELGTLGYCS